MSNLFAEFCLLSGIQNANKLLRKNGAFNFLNKFYIPAIYKTQPFNNIDAFNPDTKSNYCHGWEGFCDGSKTFSDHKDDLINRFMEKKGGLCFPRCFFSHLVLNSAGIDNHVGRGIVSSFTPTPHSIQGIVSLLKFTKILKSLQ